MRFLFFLCFISIQFHSTSQIQINETTKTNPKRFLIANTAIGAVSFGSLIGLQQLWYSKESQESFHFFDDSKNWMQMDKFGHTMSSYELTKTMSNVYEWSGLSTQKSRLLSASVALGYMSAIEIMDGFSSDWGFSVSDMGANLIGSGLFLFQEKYFSKQIFQPNFSFHPTRFSEIRPEILGENPLESILKDYNGQTYWICFSPGNLGVSAWPKWLMLSMGHSIDGRLKGDSGDYMGYHSSREFLFSLDVDLTELNVRSKFLTSLFEIINCIKIPFPTLIYNKGDFNVLPVYF
ncbi:YfiM family protein [Crocinitomicaceae bacterium]|nr:YfiM family protein [Crocinitomicaceae bacterium]